MGHLTEEQFEDILQGAIPVPEHGEHCPACRARLEEKRALARRVRKAFSSLEAPAGLADRIRAATIEGKVSSDPNNKSRATSHGSRPGRIIPLHLHRRLWSGLAAAAAILLVALPVALYTVTGSRASAAEVALTEIHHSNLDSLGQTVSNEDPNKFCAYLESQLGHKPALLRAGSSLRLCCCCMRRFQGQPVASYVVQGKTAPISLVAVSQSPESLGLSPAQDATAAAQGIWLGKHKCCNIASIRMGEYTYCAIGQVGQPELAGVLSALAAE